MSKAKKETGVAVSGQFTKENVPALLAQVNAKIDKLTKNFGGDEPGLTNDDLDGFGSISNISDVSELIKAVSSVQGREAGYKVAIKEIKADGVTLTKFPFKINGSGSSAWIKQINRRLGEVTYKDELAKLKAAATHLEKHVSEEQQFANDMKKFADVIGLE